MNKFFKVLFMVLAWVLLVVAAGAFINAFVAMGDGKDAEVGGSFAMCLGALISSGLVWTLRNVLAYTSRRLDEMDAAEEYQAKEA